MSNDQRSSVAQRYAQMQDWLHEKAGYVFKCASIVPLAGDASFRRYFRAFGSQGEHYVVMDAPPDKENVQAFVDIAALLNSQGVRTPEILVQDVTHGFLLLSDVGDRLYLDALSDSSHVNVLHEQACEVLSQIQHAPPTPLLRPYSAEMYRKELQLFLDWYIPYYKQERPSALSPQKRRWLENDLFEGLIHSALEQPQVCVHRDYHSRNLMLDQEGRLVVLDFQDAAWGPVTYDLVSLLKDCYKAWDTAQVAVWLEATRQKHSFHFQVDPGQFRRWFDWMGLQRHLKCLGIFVRLHVRDHKSRYLSDIPRVLGYVTQVAERYPECKPLLSIL